MLKSTCAMHGGLKGLTQAPGGERGTLPAGSRRARGRLLLRCEVATAKWVAMQIPGVGKGSSNSHRTSAALMLTATLAEGSTAGTGCWVCRVCGGIGGIERPVWMKTRKSSERTWRAHTSPGLGRTLSPGCWALELVVAGGHKLCYGVLGV